MSARIWSPRVILALAWGLVAVTVITCALHLQKTHHRLEGGHRNVDFQVYHRNAQVAAAGGNIYETHRSERIYPYLYPPFLVSILRPLSGLSLATAVLLWNLLQLLLIPVGFELLRRLLGALQVGQPALLAGVGVLLSTWYFVDNIVWAQVNLWVWLCVLGALLLYQKDRLVLSGALVAVAFSIKLMPLLLLLLLPALSVRRAGRWLGGVAAGLLICCFLLPGLISGFGWALERNGDFLRLLHKTALGGSESLPWGNNCANHSLLFALHHWFGQCAPKSQQLGAEAVHAVYGLLRVVLVAGTLCTAALLRWRADRPVWMLAVAQLLLAMLLVNPITWIHHWVLLTLALTLLAGLALQAELPPRQRVSAAVVTALLCGMTVAGPQLEEYKPGTLSMGHYFVWLGITGLMLWLQAPALGRGRVTGAAGSGAGVGGD